jgi:hypothetical protein
MIEAHDELETEGAVPKIRLFDDNLQGTSSIRALESTAVTLLYRLPLSVVHPDIHDLANEELDADGRIY